MCGGAGMWELNRGSLSHVSVSAAAPHTCSKFRHSNPSQGETRLLLCHHAATTTTATSKKLFYCIFM
ncbi:hypothetical protein E2C01_029051 [Portunus trituberculatus]|uniref:Uncharacterized protein n=1 Tax=Portunus trituberculatus TaxID=210409 RepID=A0A5B7EQH2_PORTR|nr:hypothetical protein [Portunus trituberculatus]